MIALRFRKEAEADLRDIVSYYQDIAPEALPRILDDIHHALRRLQDYPQLGAAVEERSFRRIVTLRYHFKIAYLIEEPFLTVLGIFRYQDRES
jgi:plasmid stabilization system protein ParE